MEREKKRRKGSTLLNIYSTELELHGVLIFATEQRPSLAEEGGPLISTGHFIHNYPLIYGFAGRDVEAYSVMPSLHFLSYRDLAKSRFVPKLANRSLRYGFIEEQLQNILIRREAIYVFPAIPESVVVKKVFMQAKGSGYAEFRGALKTIYPRLEHYIAIVPPSRFRTLVLTVDRELPGEMYIRIGMKRMGLFKAYLSKAEISGRVDSPSWSTIPVNLYDVGLFGYNAIDLMKVLETRSKPPNKPLSSVIGYIRARNLFVLRDMQRMYRVPLPLKLVEGS